MTVGPPAQPSFGNLPVGWFRELKIGHDPNDPPEATLSLAATAAANGLRCDGDSMGGGKGAHAPSLQAIARQLCLPISAVRRGVKHLIAIGAVHLDSGVRAHPAALRVRWANYRQRLCLTTEARRLRMRPRVLLLVGLIAGQLDPRGQLKLGIGFLMERTGFPRRVVERALAIARRRRAIHTWLARNEWQMYLALGPSRSGARRNGSEADPLARECSEQQGRCESAGPPVANRRHPHREAAAPPSQSGARPPDSPGLPPVSPSEAPASPAGETRAAPAAEREPSELQNTPVNVCGAIDAWVKRHAEEECFGIANAMHVAEVAMLIDSISPRPAVIHNPRAFARERSSLARLVIRWCPWPDRLGRWLVRVHRWFRVQNLGAYLRRASEKGNPDTLLHSHSKNILGRAAETWRDFSPPTEHALRGPRADEIEQLVAGIGGVLAVPDEGHRVQLREELARYWRQQRRVPARIALQRLVGSDHSDVAIAHATEGILTLKQAKWLLRAA